MNESLNDSFKCDNNELAVLNFYISFNEFFFITNNYNNI